MSFARLSRFLIFDKSAWKYFREWLPVADAISSKTASPFSWFLPTNPILYPNFAKSRAVCLPRPSVAPVIIQFLFYKFNYFWWKYKNSKA